MNNVIEIDMAWSGNVAGFQISSSIFMLSYIYEIILPLTDSFSLPFYVWSLTSIHYVFCQFNKHASVCELF